MAGEGRVAEKTKQNNHQGSHLTRNHVPTSQTGAPHNTWTSGKVLEGYYLSARKKISPRLKTALFPSKKKLKNKPQMDQKVPKFICVQSKLKNT